MKGSKSMIQFLPKDALKWNSPIWQPLATYGHWTLNFNKKIQFHISGASATHWIVQRKTFSQLHKILLDSSRLEENQLNS